MVVRYLSLVLFFLLSACSSTLILPEPQPGSQIDMAGQRSSQGIKGIRLAVRLHEAVVRPSPAEQNYASFWVEVYNQRNVLLPLSASDFILLDDQGQQYLTVAANELVEHLSDVAPYLIPYPYVGYYYLEDSLRSAADTRLRGEADYFASRRPRYLKTEALPEAEVLPNATLAGAIYFPVELRQMSRFHLHYQSGALPGQKSYSLSFPFRVEKK